MYIIYAKWKKNIHAEIWEVDRCLNLKQAKEMFDCYTKGFGNIYHLWVSEVN